MPGMDQIPYNWILTHGLFAQLLRLCKAVVFSTLLFIVKKSQMHTSQSSVSKRRF